MGGIAQRRASRSPRCQRSRSADVDRLKKYTERRIEERRHTDASAGSLRTTGSIKITGPPPSPLLIPPSNRIHSRRGSTIPSGNKFPTGTRRRSETTGERYISFGDDPSNSASAPTRWITFTNNPSPFPPSRRNSSEKRSRKDLIDPNCSTSEPMRWITFPNNPSPIPPSRRNSAEKRSRGSIVESSVRARSSIGEIKLSSPKPDRRESVDFNNEKKKDSPNRKIEKEDKGNFFFNKISGSTGKDVSPGLSNSRAQRLSQRMRELYDFKTEHDWPEGLKLPKALQNSSNSKQDENNESEKKAQQKEHWFRENKSTIQCSEDQKDSADKDRREKNIPWQQSFRRENSDKQKNERATPRAMRSYEERTDNSENTIVRQRRTHSDDYDEREMVGRHSTVVRKISGERIPLRRESEIDEVFTSGFTPRSSYAEIDLSEASGTKRNSRTSDVSYATIACSERTSSIDSNANSTKLIERLARRGSSMIEEASNSPKVQNAANEKSIAERKKRNSTRYKVYLT